MRRSLALVALALVAGAAYLAVTFVHVVLAARRDGAARGADAIVVFGAAQYDGNPSPVLRARLDHAVLLYRRRVARTVVVTGGRRPGDRLSEATASANYLSRRGVPQSAVLREVSGRTSWQSLAAAAHFLKERRMTRVVLVSDPFHSARIAAMAEELGLSAVTSPTRTSPIQGVDAVPYLGKEAAFVAVGRVVGFGRVAGIDRTLGRVRGGLESG